MDVLLDSALKLHTYLFEQCWTGHALVGSDPGIRFNARIGRFVKSYLSFVPWPDRLTYMQAQGYWIMDQWLLADALDEESHSLLAIATAHHILRCQRPEGYWEYPNPEWRGRVATVEGCFAALGLLECYARVGDKSYLAGAENWYHYLTNTIGFRRQREAGMSAINYFAHESGTYGGGVPNNSTLVLWLMARLAEVTQDDRFLTHCASLVAWLAHVQCESGELPYEVGSDDRNGRLHFLCYQYNAFEFMDLVHYYRITNDQHALPILRQLAIYLANGLTAAGVGRYACDQATPEVLYYTSAIAQALSQATALGLGDFRALAAQGLRHVMSRQRPDGGFEFYSRANYRILSDRRVYPRYLAMILNHLLREYQTGQAEQTEHTAQLGHQEESRASSIYMC